MIVARETIAPVGSMQVPLGILERDGNIMAFPDAPTTVPLVLPTQVLSGITYDFGRISISVNFTKTTLTMKAYVGVTNGDGFRTEKVKAIGPDLATVSVNFAAIIAVLV